MSSRKRVGVLISGRGSNMASLVKAARAPDYPAEIALVLSNRPDAPGLKFAADANIATATVDHKAFPDRASFELALHDKLVESHIDIVCNAGFMRVLTSTFVDRWHDRHLNIHPSLLPAYKGLNTHERALADGCRISGCTVHIVRAALDDGPIIAQAAVPVIFGDTPDSLAARVLEAEHKLYPHALGLLAAGNIQIEGETVIDTDQGEPSQTLYSPPIV